MTYDSGIQGVLLHFRLCFLVVMINISLWRSSEIKERMHLFHLPITLKTAYIPEDRNCTVVVPVRLFSPQYMEVGFNSQDLLQKVLYLYSGFWQNNIFLNSLK